MDPDLATPASVRNLDISVGHYRAMDQIVKAPGGRKTPWFSHPITDSSWIFIPREYGRFGTIPIQLQGGHW